MPAYAFKNPHTAKTLAEMVERNPPAVLLNIPNQNDIQTRVNLSKAAETIPGRGEQDASEEIPAAWGTVEKFSTADEETIRLHSISGARSSLHGLNAEPTPIPQNAEVLALSDTFNRTLLVTPTPSEVFGRLENGFSGTSETSAEIQLLAGYTVYGSDILKAFPAPSIDFSESIPAGTVVECRYVKSAGKWFFFRRKGRSSPTADLSGYWYSGGWCGSIPAIPSNIFFRRWCEGCFPAQVVQVGAVQSCASPWIWLDVEGLIQLESSCGIHLQRIAFEWDWDKQTILNYAPVCVYDGSRYRIPSAMGFIWESQTYAGSIFGECGTVDDMPAASESGDGRIIYWNAFEGRYQLGNSAERASRGQDPYSLAVTLPLDSEDGASFSFLDEETGTTETFQVVHQLFTDPHAPGSMTWTGSEDGQLGALWEDYEAGGLMGTFTIQTAQAWDLAEKGRPLEFFSFAKSGSSFLSSPVRNRVSLECVPSDDGYSLRCAPVWDLPKNKEYSTLFDYLTSADSDSFPLRERDGEFYFPDPEFSQGRWICEGTDLHGTFSFYSEDGNSWRDLTIQELYSLRKSLIYGTLGEDEGYILEETWIAPTYTPGLNSQFRGVYTPAPELAEEFTLSGEWTASWTKNFKTSIALVNFNSQKGIDP